MLQRYHRMAGQDQVASHVLQNNHYLLCSVLESKELVPQAVAKGLLTVEEGDEIATRTQNLGDGAGMAKLMELVLVRPSSFKLFLEILEEKEALKTWATYLRNDYEAEMMMLQELMSRNSSASPQHLETRAFNYSDPILNKRSSQSTVGEDMTAVPTFSSSHLLAEFKKAKGSKVDVVDKLLKKYESQCIVRNVFDVDMKSLLHLACELMDFRVVKLLVEKYNFNPNDQDVAGNTALHIASKAGKSQIVVYLLGYPACDPNIRDRGGYTAYHLAFLGGRNSITRFFKKCKRMDHAVVEEVKRISISGNNPGIGSGGALDGWKVSGNSVGKVPGITGGELPGTTGGELPGTTGGKVTKKDSKNHRYSKESTARPTTLKLNKRVSDINVSSNSEVNTSSSCSAKRVLTRTPTQNGIPTVKENGRQTSTADASSLQLSEEDSREEKMQSNPSHLPSKDSQQNSSTSEGSPTKCTIPGCLAGETPKQEGNHSQEPHEPASSTTQDSHGNGHDDRTSLAHLYQQTRRGLLIRQLSAVVEVDGAETPRTDQNHHSTTSWQQYNRKAESHDRMQHKPDVALTMESGDDGNGSGTCCCFCLCRRKYNLTKQKRHTGSCCSFRLVQVIPSILWLALGVLIGIAVVVAVVVLLVLKDRE